MEALQNKQKQTGLNQRPRLWKLDIIRNDDRSQMQNMIRKLKKFRTEDQAGAKKPVAQRETDTQLLNNNRANPQQNKMPMKKSGINFFLKLLGGLPQNKIVKPKGQRKK